MNQLLFQQILQIQYDLDIEIKKHTQLMIFFIFFINHKPFSKQEEEKKTEI